MGFSNFDDFWPFYVSQHMKPWTRRLHFAGTTAGFGFLASFAATGEPRLILWGIAVSYGFAWIGHFFVEKNRPATFKYPWLSFRGDLRMYAFMLMGGMERELERLRPELDKYVSGAGR